MISNRNDHYQGIQICHALMDELGFQQRKPPSKQLPSSLLLLRSSTAALNLDFPPCFGLEWIDFSSSRSIFFKRVNPLHLLSVSYGVIEIHSSIPRATVGKFGSRSDT